MQQPPALVQAARLTILMLFVPCTGCTGAHLYNHERHVIAQTAQADLKDLKLKEALEPQRTRQAELLGQEIAVARRQVLAERDATLVNVLARTAPGAVSDLRTAMQSRVKELAAKPSDAVTAVKELRTASADLHKAEFTIRSLARSRRVEKVPPFDCPLAQAGSSVVDDLKGLYEDFAAACANVVAATASLKDAGGEIGKAALEGVQAAEAVVKLDEERKHAADEARAKLKKLESEAGRENRKDLAKLVEKALKELSELEGKPSEAAKVLAKLGFGSQDSLAARAAVIEVKRAALVEILTGLGAGIGGQANPQQGPGLMPAVRYAFVLGDVYRTAETALARPELGVLTLQSERLRLDAEAIERQVQRVRTRVGLLADRQAALVVELEALVEADRALADVQTSCGDETISAVYKRGCDENLVRGLFKYAEAYSVGRADQAEILRRLIAQRYERVLDQSEEALEQWVNLITVPVAQLEALHGAGVKPEEMARLLFEAANVAGLFYVGSQVK
jgi:hypothetical protein